jgi:hypothetical protein
MPSKDIAKLTRGEPGTLIIPDDQGDLKMRGENFTHAHGPLCETKQAELARAIGGSRGDVEHLPEYGGQQVRQQTSG